MDNSKWERPFESIFFAGLQTRISGSFKWYYNGFFLLKGKWTTSQNCLLIDQNLYRWLLTPVIFGNLS